MADVYFEDATSLPAHTLFCIGHHYVAHARELDTVPQQPEGIIVG